MDFFSWFCHRVYRPMYSMYFRLSQLLKPLYYDVTLYLGITIYIIHSTYIPKYIYTEDETAAAQSRQEHEVNTRWKRVHSSEIYVWWNCLEKSFKICHIFGIRKPKYILSFFFDIPRPRRHLQLKKKSKFAWNEKRKNLVGFLYSKKNGNFWNFFIVNFIKHIPLIFEERCVYCVL